MLSISSSGTSKIFPLGDSFSSRKNIGNRSASFVESVGLTVDDMVSVNIGRDTEVG